MNTIKLGGKKVDPKVNSTSDKLGNLINNGVAERVYLNTMKKPTLKI